MGGDHAPLRFTQHVAADAPGEQVLRADGIAAALLAHQQRADVPGAGAPRQLGARIDVEWRAGAREADTAREEGSAVLRDATELEDVGVTQEEVDRKSTRLNS